MPTFDWIVVGNGLAGAALSYELSRQGFAVLLLDEKLEPAGATRFSYGGIPYWAGTTDLTCQLFEEGRARHRALPDELGADTHLRELDLLLTMPVETNVAEMVGRYSHFATPPQLISPKDAYELEPQLDPQALEGALTVRQGHVNPQALIAAYNQAFVRLGGTVMIARVTGLVRIKNRVTGVATVEQALAAGQVAIAAGGYTRALLRQAGLKVPLYYSHAELIETPPVDFEVRSLIMPADALRFPMEAQASTAEVDALWDQPGHEVAPPALDSGVVQFRDGHLRIGQISRAITNLEPTVDQASSDRTLRRAITQQMPRLQDVPGTWRHCLVTFSRDGLPLAGPLPGVAGLHLFSGFSSPFGLLPPIATRFAKRATGQPDELLEPMQPQRFLQA